MPTKKKTAKKGEPKPPKTCREPIPYEMIYRLIDRYSAPLQSIPEDSTAAIWAAVAELKGWMEKKGGNIAHGMSADPHNFRSVAWQELRGMLNDAVEQNNPSAFNTLSKAWRECEVRKPSPRFKNSRAQTIIDPWKENEESEKRKLAENIENLIPALPTKDPNSPRKIDFLEAVLDLQRKWKRAPTRREIEERTGISKKGISKKDVCDMVKDMGLGDLLSSPRSKKAP
jgi:hypothetical protein